MASHPKGIAILKGLDHNVAKTFCSIHDATTEHHLICVEKIIFHAKKHLLLLFTKPGSLYLDANRFSA